MRSRFLRALFIVAVLVFALGTPLVADSKADTMKPAGESAKSADTAALREQLEAEYREALRARIAEETASHKASLTNLWISNAAVWSVLMLFVIMQALSARKRAAELERLRSAREGGS